MLAKHELPRGQWEELSTFIFQYCHSQNPQQREIGLLLLSSVLETAALDVNHIYISHDLMTSLSLCVCVCVCVCLVQATFPRSISVAVNCIGRSSEQSSSILCTQVCDRLSFPHPTCFVTQHTPSLSPSLPLSLPLSLSLDRCLTSMVEYVAEEDSVKSVKVTLFNNHISSHSIGSFYSSSTKDHDSSPSIDS